MNKQFVKTKDEHTKDELLKAGLILVSENSGVYTFINDASKMNFAKFENVVTSNTLEF